MSNRVPIFGNKRLSRWRSNFIASPFEVKILTIIVVLITAVTLLSFVQNDVGKIVFGIAFPGGAIFLTQACFAALRLCLREQTLAIQLTHRTWFISLFIMVLIFYWASPPPLQRYNESEQIFKTICMYRPYYNLWLPICMILAMATRTIPMSIKYIKLKKQEKAVTLTN